MSDIADDRKLLQFSVGPVLCCADSIDVYRIIEPPEHLVHLPGHSQHPTIFRHENRVVTVIDMRTLFGLTPAQNAQGVDKLIIAELDQGLFAYWVDEVSTIVSDSDGKWGFLPTVVPRTLFDSAFNLQGKLILHVDFSKLVDAEATPWVYESGLYHEEVAEVEGGAEVVADTDLNPSSVPERQKPVAPEVPEKTVKPASIPVAESRPRPSETMGHGSGAATQATRHKAALPSVAQVPTIEASSRVESAPVDQDRLTPRPEMADEHQWQSSDEPESPIVELEQERSGWLLPVFIVLLLLLGSGYLLSSFLEESPKLPEVSAGTPLAMKQPAASTVSESVPVIVSEPVPDEKETSVEEALVEDVVIVDEVEPASSITREGDLVTITVYEEVQAEVIAELEQSEGGMTDKAQHQASVVVAQEDTAADIVEPVEEGLNVVWSTHRQAQVDLASEGGQQLKSVNEAKQAVQLEPVPLRPVLTIEEIVHVVVKGDTLWDIAERYIHDPFRYPELARLSQIQNPDLIYPGDRVRIRIIRHAEGNGGQ